MLRTLLVVLFIALYIATVGVFMVLYGLVTRHYDGVYTMGLTGVKLALRIGGVRVVREGWRGERAGDNFVYAVNHVSNVDPPAIVTVLPRVAIPAKHTVFRIPILSIALRMTGFIPVVRGTRQAAETVDAGVEVLRRGLSMVVFPEGTRSPSYELMPFRRGVFLMAIRAGVPVVPVTLVGSREVMPRESLWLRPGTIRAVFHPPVPTVGLRDEDRQELADRIRAIVATALPLATAEAVGNSKSKAQS